MDSRVMYWFRTDLRLHDSPGLEAVLSLKPAAFFPVWCWDPNYVFKHRVGVVRYGFLLESMQNLSDRICEVQPKSQLLVVRGEPTQLLPALWRQWDITHLVFEKDPSGYGRRRDNAIRKLAHDANVEVVAVQGHHLFDPKDVVHANKGRPIAKALGPVPKPLPAPTTLPLPLLPPARADDGAHTQASLLARLAESVAAVPIFDAATGSCLEGPPSVDVSSVQLGGQRTGEVRCFESVVGDAGAPPFAVPTVASLGMDPRLVSSVVKGGESAALARLASLCNNPEYCATFSKPHTSPGKSVRDPSTTLMSPYLKFGCIGVRRLWWDFENAKAKYKGKKKQTEQPENFKGQIMFRDMFASAEFAVGDNFARMDWNLQTVYNECGDPVTPRPPGDSVSEARLAAFKDGRTGFPWIDALMRQLKQEGWMHHLGRHSVAAFLTRGQCWISWERGAEIFDEYLIDWDPSANPANWMWLSCSAFYSQYFKLYGLVSFPQKYDKSGALVREYCPELAKFPNEFIYSPHLAPLAVQKKAGCIIGTDYPWPMLDEKAAKEENMARMKVCFAANFYGNSKEVIDGDADRLLKDLHKIGPPKEWEYANSAAKNPWTIASDSKRRKIE